jgi:hypothetical protein
VNPSQVQVPECKKFSFIARQGHHIILVIIIWAEVPSRKIDSNFLVNFCSSVNPNQLMVLRLSQGGL